VWVVLVVLLKWWSSCSNLRHGCSACTTGGEFKSELQPSTRVVGRGYSRSEDLCSTLRVGVTRGTSVWVAVAVGVCPEVDNNRGRVKGRK
jgi:hypothetical protein